MDLNIKQNEDYVFANKPSGIATHAPSEKQYGFVEYLSEGLKIPLKVCHRLDKETSGAIVFAKSTAAASKLGKLFESSSVRKKYIFLTDRVSKRRKLTLENKNGKTEFSLLKQEKKLSLWEATPTTGKFHQIRVHAAENGIPILGDREYRGTSFPRLMLHAESIKCALFEFNSPLPNYFSRLNQLSDKQLLSWLIAYENRKAVFNIGEEDTLRLLHSEDRLLKADKYGSVACFYWYGDSLPPNEKISTFTETINIKNYSIAAMSDRGKNSSSIKLTKNSSCPDSWQALENGARFELRLNQGSSPGLFLDQRNNRDWVKQNSKDKKVLNLFSYTGGFSIAAALGGAKSITSVDTSAASHEWVKKNFSINELGLDNCHFETQDVRVFLEKNKEKFDLIICDPPTFARSKSSIFAIEKECKKLIQSCLNALSPNGTLLFSTNYEKWQVEDLINQIPDSSSLTIRTNSSDLDFEAPGIPAKLKCISVTKLS